VFYLLEEAFTCLANPAHIKQVTRPPSSTEAEVPALCSFRQLARARINSRDGG
jgi:hypothetical protein